MGEFILKDLVSKRDLGHIFGRIESCAVSREEIGNEVYPPARAELSKHGISCKGKRARQLTFHDYEEFDYILVMDKSNLRLANYILGDSRMDKVHMLLDRDVADPWYTGDFSQTYNDILEGCENLIVELSSKI
jgi:protein-tyrosine phosphatase